MRTLPTLAALTLLAGWLADPATLRADGQFVDDGSHPRGLARQFDGPFGLFGVADPAAEVNPVGLLDHLDRLVGESGVHAQAGPDPARGGRLRVQVAERGSGRGGVADLFPGQPADAGEPLAVLSRTPGERDHRQE